MTTASHYYIVGEEFGAFAKNAGVLTVSKAIHELRAGALDRAELTPALGLSNSDRHALCAALQATGAETDSIARFAPAQESLALTHKRDAEHIMIGPMQRVCDSEYECTLLVNALCDRLSDHVTGQHLGGMLLIEAARQGVIAAIELEYGQEGQRKLGLAWSALRVDFQAFAFPLPATLRIRLSEAPVAASQQPNVKLEISVEQGGKPVSGLAFEITLFEAALLQKIEAKAAARAVDKHARQRVQSNDKLLLAG